MTKKKELTQKKVAPPPVVVKKTVAKKPVVKKDIVKELSVPAPVVEEKPKFIPVPPEPEKELTMDDIKTTMAVARAKMQSDNPKVVAEGEKEIADLNVKFKSQNPPVW